MYARTTSVELCEEDKTEPGDENRCGTLIKSTYGTRTAAHEWQSEVTRTMTDLEFKQGKASPHVFWHRQRGIKALVHGDDFVSSSERTELEWLCKGLKKQVQTKMTMVEEDDDLHKEVRVLNRFVRWHPRKGSHTRLIPRHSERISRDAGAEKLKTISTPAAKETGRETEEVKRQDVNERRLSGMGGKMDEGDNGDTLSAAVRANFLAQDIMDIAFATKEATRKVASPKMT